MRARESRPLARSSRSTISASSCVASRAARRRRRHRSGRFLSRPGSARPPRHRSAATAPQGRDARSRAVTPTAACWRRRGGRPLEPGGVRRATGVGLGTGGRCERAEPTAEGRIRRGESVRRQRGAPRLLSLAEGGLRPAGWFIVRHAAQHSQTSVILLVLPACRHAIASKLASTMPPHSAEPGTTQAELPLTPRSGLSADRPRNAGRPEATARAHGRRGRAARSSAPQPPAPSGPIALWAARSSLSRDCSSAARKPPPASA